MPFTTEDDLRLRFQFNDTVQVPSALVAAGIEDAHQQILRFLDPAHQNPPVPAALVLGETYLAGANVFRALASREALDQKRIAIGNQRIEDGRRFQALMAMSAAAAEQAWMHLEPYLQDRPSLAPGDASASAPILGEE